MREPTDAERERVTADISLWCARLVKNLGNVGLASELYAIAVPDAKDTPPPRWVRALQELNRSWSSLLLVVVFTVFAAPQVVQVLAHVLGLGMIFGPFASSIFCAGALWTALRAASLLDHPTVPSSQAGRYLAAEAELASQALKSTSSAQVMERTRAEVMAAVYRWIAVVDAENTPAPGEGDEYPSVARVPGPAVRSVALMQSMAEIAVAVDRSKAREQSA